jgi:hypothetical protein
MPRARPDRVSLVAAAVLLALGALLLLDAGDVLELTFAVLAPAACASIGAILLARGLARQR